MSTDYYLAMVTQKWGRIKGETPSKEAEDQIQIMDFRIAANSPTRYEAGEGTFTSTGAVRLEEVEFLMPTSTAIPAIYDAICTNEVIKTATLTCRKPIGRGPQAGSLKLYLQWRFHLCKVTHYELYNGPKGDPILKMRLAYNKVEVAYLRQQPDGSLAPAVKASHNALDHKAFESETFPDEKGWGSAK